MGAVRRPCPQPQQRIVCIRSEEPPKNRARFLGLIGQSSWRYLPDYTRHLWPIKDELGTATWLVKGRPEGSRRDNIAPSRRVYRTRISPPGRESYEPVVADRTGLTDPCACTARCSSHRLIGWSGQQLLKKGYLMLQRLALSCVAALVMASSPARSRAPGVSASEPVTSSLSLACKASLQRPTRWFRIRRPAFAKPSSISG